jgi:hypothetical protein
MDGLEHNSGGQREGFLFIVNRCSDEYVTYKSACKPFGGRDLTRSDDTPFASEKDCSSYFKTGK